MRQNVSYTSTVGAPTDIRRGPPFRRFAVSVLAFWSYTRTPAGVAKLLEHAADGSLLALLFILPAAIDPAAVLAFEPIKASLLRMAALAIGVLWLIVVPAWLTTKHGVPF